MFVCFFGGVHCKIKIGYTLSKHISRQSLIIVHMKLPLGQRRAQENETQAEWRMGERDSIANIKPAKILLASSNGLFLGISFH